MKRIFCDICEKPAVTHVTGTVTVRSNMVVSARINVTVEYSVIAPDPPVVFMEGTHICVACVKVLVDVAVEKARLLENRPD